MKLSMLDTETKRVLVSARAVARNPSKFYIEKLNEALADFDKKHEIERAQNLFNAIWPKRKGTAK